MSNKLHTFVESLTKALKVVPEKELLETMTNALDRKISKVELKNDPELIEDIRVRIESYYKLSEGSLNNAFRSKSEHLTEPKLVWVMCCLRLFHGDRPKVQRLVKNGITRQTIYTYIRKFKNLSDLPHEKQIKKNYEKIISHYE